MSYQIEKRETVSLPASGSIASRTTPLASEVVKVVSDFLASQPEQTHHQWKFLGVDTSMGNKVKLARVYQETIK